MDEKLAQKIRPLYSEFQGYLSQAPTIERPHDTCSDNSLWLQYNDAVNLLSQISAKDYTRFLIQTKRSQYREFIYLASYRQKLGGLISHLHAEYFSDEPAPFSGMPSTVISQTQQQNQSIQMLLDIQSKIYEALPKYPDGSKEKGFLEEFKDKLKSVRSITDLLSICFSLAEKFGLTIAMLSKLFG